MCTSANVLKMQKYIRHSQAAQVRLSPSPTFAIHELLSRRLLKPPVKLALPTSVQWSLSKLTR